MVKTMFDEIVSFSKKLETMGFYDRILQERGMIDKPIMVIPLDDNLERIETDKIHVIVKDVQHMERENPDDKEQLRIIFDNKIKNVIRNKEITIERNDTLTIKPFNRISDEEWKNVLLALSFFTQKLPNDPRGNKSIGGNNGTNSYHILIFEAKVDDKSSITANEDKFKAKFIRNTYGRKDIILKGIPSPFSVSDTGRDFIVDDFVKILNTLSSVENVEKIWKVIYQLKELFRNKTKESSFHIPSFFVIFKLPPDMYNVYRLWYDSYISKKIFKTDNEKVFIERTCHICKMKQVITYLPDAFNNWNEGKLFLRHHNRRTLENTMICRECALYIHKFHQYFMKMLEIQLFPLMIEHSNQEKTIQLLKRGKRIERKNFDEIIDHIVRETNRTVLDFYLVLYRDWENIIFFDYITGFQTYFKGVYIFDLLRIFDQRLFTHQKKENYYLLSQSWFNVTTNDNRYKVTFYKYKDILFNFFYRAQYYHLSVKNLHEMFWDLFQAKLHLFIVDDLTSIQNVYDMFSAFNYIESLFEGDLMERIEAIKANRSISSKESCAYYGGQLVYYLLSRSKAGEKRHAMVEPFINVVTFGSFADRVESIFIKFKHEIAFHFKEFNRFFSEFWQFIHENQGEKFDRSAKILFYAGYFNASENIFYEKKREQKDTETEKLMNQ